MLYLQIDALIKKIALRKILKDVSKSIELQQKEQPLVTFLFDILAGPNFERLCFALSTGLKKLNRFCVGRMIP